MKEKIFQQDGIPKDQQGIIWSGIQLGGSCSSTSSSKTELLSEYEGTGESMNLNCECANKDTLGFWNIPDGAKMTLVIKLRGC